MTSLRRRLFVILIAATSVIWLCAIVWIRVETKSEVEHVLDTRLQEAARMVSSMASRGDLVVAGADTIAPRPVPSPIGYERQLSCQIWSLDGRLVARSGGAPDSSLAVASTGFSDRLVDGESWRVFAIEDTDKGIRVLVGDRLGLRERLVTDLIMGVLTPVSLIVPLLGLLIWASLAGGLRPLATMADHLRKRDADDMSAITVGGMHAEIRPLADALNGLFGKVEAARQHEREITAFAAHELRTPLAGLRTQAQIAIAATEPAMRDNALRQIVVSVDRTARLIRQLLAIARLDATSPDGPEESIDVGRALAEVIDASPPAAGVTIDVDPALQGVVVAMRRENLILVLHNLHENAVQHMTGGGRVHWGGVITVGGAVTVFVEDEGPGIPLDELAMVGRRFFRGRHRSPSGSGLGLAIVALALPRATARFRLENRGDRTGVRASIEWPTAPLVPR